jgi:hypothetical protein
VSVRCCTTLDSGVVVDGVAPRGSVCSPQYRRDDSDDPGDRYRLYELAGAPHMGTRVAPFDDASLWQATHGNSASPSALA